MAVDRSGALRVVWSPTATSPEIAADLDALLGQHEGCHRLMTDDRSIPAGFVLARTTDVFDRDTVPAGLLRAHRVAADVWGRLVVHAGTVRFVFEDTPDEPVDVDVGSSVVIPPARLHHVELGEGARFAVEFHRRQRPPQTPG